MLAAVIKLAQAGCRLLLLGAALLPRADAAGDDLAARTVVVANADDADSVALGQFYVAQRGLPAANLIALPLPADESITWRRFVDEVWQPLQDELIRRGWLDGLASAALDRLGRKKAVFASHRVAYLVLCRGAPLRIFHDPGLLPESEAARMRGELRTNQGSVDSELSLLAAGNYDVNGLVPNPLFGRSGPPSIEGALVIKVARLDGPTAADARHLVTSALAGERDGLLGRWYVDLRGPNPEGDKWLESTRRRLEDLGFDGDVENTPATFDPAARFDAPVLYFGWYAQDANGPFAQPDFRFPPGAIAEHIHSFSAQTLRSASSGWCGPLVARGAAATVGNVFEPYLSFVHHPDLLLQALAGGATLGDAAYLALPALSWQGVLVGDPLYRPFKVSAEEQRKHLAQLPSELAPYALVRSARLLARVGRTAEARSMLEEGSRRYAGLVLPLARARLAVEQGDEAGAVGILEAMPPAGFRTNDWALAREAADFLAHHLAEKGALKIYDWLTRAPAPTPDALRAVCAEGREVAEKVGDTERAAAFAALAGMPAAGTP